MEISPKSWGGLYGASQCPPRPCPSHVLWFGVPQKDMFPVVDFMLTSSPDVEVWSLARATRQNFKIVINQSIKCSPSLAVAAGDSGLLRSRLLTLLPKQRALKWLAASSVTRGYWYWKKWGWTGRNLSWLSVTSFWLQSEEAVEEPLYQCADHSIPQTEPFLERS